MDEVGKIMEVIDNEDFEEFVMLEVLRSRKDDENLSSVELKKLKGWK